MKKDIRDFHNNPYIIDIPDQYKHSFNAISIFFESLLSQDDIYKKMKSLYSGKCVIGIKFSENTTPEQEYYFYKKDVLITEFAKEFGIDFLKGYENWNYFGYTVQFGCNTDIIKEINICDTNKNYILSQENFQRKNIYFYFHNSEYAKIMKEIKNIIFPIEDKYIFSLLQWRKYQNRDGEIILGKKIFSETIYFSHISFLGLLHFLQTYNLIDNFVKIISENKDFLRFYYFDIGIEYSFQKGYFQIIKTSIYGLL